MKKGLRILSLVCSVLLLMACSSQEEADTVSFDWVGDKNYTSPNHVNVTDAQNQSTGLEENWWVDTAFYHIWVKGFNDSNDDGGGDLKGIQDKLSYIQDTLGCDGIWLSPIFECSYKGKEANVNMHGYDVTDHYSINSYFGTEEELENLIKACHDRGMKIIFDFVPNHTSSAHPWFTDSAAQADKNDWFLWSDTKLSWNPGMGTSDTWHSSGSRYYYGAFNGTMPDLNYRNYEVREEMKNVVRYWLNKGFDGLRVDAVRYLVEEYGAYCDTAASHQWYQELREVVDSYEEPKFMVCEAWIEGNRQTLEAYFGGGKEFHMVFDFDQGRATVNSIANQRDETGSSIRANKSESMAYGTFLGNHDEYIDRLGTKFAADDLRIKQATALSLLRPTVPFIYYGQELGQKNSSYGGDLRLRGSFDWSAMEEQSENQTSTLKLNNALLALRKAYPETFTKGTVIKLASKTSGTLAYLLDGDTSDFLCVYNLTNKAVAAAEFSGLEQNPTENSVLIGDVDASQIEYTGSTVTVPELSPFGYRVYLVGDSSATNLFDDQTYEAGAEHEIPILASESMYLRGTMNGWGGTEMTLNTSTGEAVWSCTVPLTAGTTYEFKFCVNNGTQWGQNWGNTSGGNFTFTPSTSGNYTFTFNETTLWAEWALIP